MCVYICISTPSPVASHLLTRVQPIWVWCWHFCSFVFVTDITIIKVEHYFVQCLLKMLLRIGWRHCSLQNIEYLCSVSARYRSNPSSPISPPYNSGFLSVFGQLIQSHGGFVPLAPSAPLFQTLFTPYLSCWFQEKLLTLHVWGVGHRKASYEFRLKFGFLAFMSVWEMKQQPQHPLYSFHKHVSLREMSFFIYLTMNGFKC